MADSISNSGSTDGIGFSSVSSAQSPISITFNHHGTPHTLYFSPSATIEDLSESIETKLSVPISNQKLMISKLGLLKPPFKDPNLPLTTLLDKKITLLGSTAAEVSSITNAAAAAASARTLRQRNPLPKVQAYKFHDWKKEQEEAQYTFTTLRPLPYLPKPERSTAFLQRLKEDPGIKHVMRKHKWTVLLLTEMNPIEHTISDHEGTSRTLGLNTNRGEMIELRLRTDAYDGYRDYKTIRKTLCHELAHNVFGPHDQDFWDLCHLIEREVEGADYNKLGRTVGDEVYRPEEEELDDHGGWTGGEYRLGVGDRSGNGSDEASTTGSQTLNISKREILARAAEERIKKSQEQRPSQGGNSSGQSG